MRRVAVTGIGVITPAGMGPDALWERLLAGRSCVKRIDRFDPSRYRCHVAAQADAFVASQWLSPRFTKRTDRFTHLAVVAAESALGDARLEIDASGGVPPERVGVMVGNVLGGWEFAERELRDLWAEGPRMVSPFQATAWFPAAPQGNIGIRFGIKGRSRTFVCDRASGAYAVIHGAETIRRGQADVVIAGGVEQPLSPYAWLCCQTGNFLVRSNGVPPEESYRPFDRGHAGMAVGEGCAFLVLEDLDHARARGASVRAEIGGWSTRTDGYMPYYTSMPSGAVLAATMRESLDRAGVTLGSLGAIVADGAALPADDAQEVAAIARLLDGAADVPVTGTKATVGHLMGAAGAVDVVAAVLALERSQLPPIANLREPAAGFDLDFVRDAPRPAPGLANVLTVSRGLGGVNASLVVSRAEDAA